MRTINARKRGFISVTLGVVRRVRTWMGNKNKISPGQDLEPDDGDDTTGQV